MKAQFDHILQSSFYLWFDDKLTRVNEAYYEPPAGQVFDAVVRGAGHFLGDVETYNRMRSDYLYPKVSNRDSIEEWELKGQKSVWDLARKRVKEILKVKGDACISDKVDKEIKKQFKIYLD